MKRIFDFFCATFMLVILWPILLIITLAIKLDSSGPVFFQQIRIGLGGNPFCMYKFRSMVCDAEALGGYFTKFEDPRITRVGRLIRRTSIDELPQVFNVLKGEMSWIGPRPDVPAQRAEYTDEEWRLRNSVPPGITGLAQAKLRSCATLKQRKALDLYYVKRRSICLDIKILLMTLRQISGKLGN